MNITNNNNNIITTNKPFRLVVINRNGNGGIQMVKSHDEVAKDWWYGRGDSEGYAVFSEGKTIYSWGRHFPIAVHTKKGFTIFNSEGYSSSTGKHKSIVRNVINGTILKLIGCDENRAEETFIMNIQTIQELTGKMSRARTRGSWYAEEIEELLEQQELIKNHYLIAKVVEDL